VLFSANVQRDQIIIHFQADSLIEYFMGAEMSNLNRAYSRWLVLTVEKTMCLLS